MSDSLVPGVGVIPCAAAATAAAPPVIRPLSHSALEDLRDAMCLPEYCIVGSSAELDFWLEQLDEAIDRGEVDVRASWEIAEEAEAERLAKLVLARLVPGGGSLTAAEIAAEVVRRLAPATRAEFITAANAEVVTGQEFRWVVAEAKRLGVPVAGTGKKRLVDVSAFRAALAAEAKADETKRVDQGDPAEQIRRLIGSAKTNGGNGGH